MADEKVTSTPPLTPKSIEKLRPQAKDYEVADSPEVAKGLRLRVSPQGARIFRWYVTGAKPRTVVTIGRWSMVEKPGHVTLAEARLWLGKLKAAHKDGRLAEAVAELQAAHPPRARTHAAPAPATGATLTVEALAKDFRTFIARRRRRPEEVDDVLDRDVLPVLGKRPVVAVTTPEVRSLVEAVVQRGAASYAGKVLQITAQLFRFAQGRGDVTANPADPLDAAALGIENNSSDRFLNAEEIPQFWHALDRCGCTPTVRDALRLLLLTGVRSGELRLATWEEVDFDKAAWVIPVDHQKLSKRAEKGARPFVVPLPPTALALFKQLRALADSIGSQNVLASWHPDAKGEPITDKALNHVMRRLFVGRKPLLSFVGERPTPHDLRRTLRTHLGETLGIAPHIAERCLNHSLGRIAKIYDRGDYLTERRAALEKWDAYVERLVAPTQASVAFLKAR